MALNDNMDMQRMQQDAIRRVREMQSRAQQSLNSASREPGRGDTANAPKPAGHTRSNASGPERAAHPERLHSPKGEPAHEAPSHPPSPSPVPGAHQENPVTDLLNGLLQDGERTLILVLILLLVSEKADTYLIFALMYLIIT